MLKPTNTASWGLVSKQIKCDKAYFFNSKSLPIKNRQTSFKPDFSLPPSPQYPIFRIPRGTSPPSEGLGEAPPLGLVRLYSRLVQLPISHRFLSHPLLRRGLGRLLLFGFGPLFFGVCFLFLSISFLPAFPSTPFRLLKDALLQCKRACFAMQKGVFYNPLCNLLILRRLQSRFFMIVS